MSDELEFLAWSRSEESLAALQAAINLFQVDNRSVSVSVNSPVPAMMWTEIINTALYRQGADIGEVGSSYITSLRGMDSLRPFTAAEIADMGGQDAFVQSLWDSGFDSKSNQLWAIPWRADTRIIFYRRDLLAKAKIKEEGAFATPAQMEQTLQTLKDSGIEVPLTLGTAAPQALTSFSTCWVWGAGGDYISPDGKKVIFDSPEALAGFRDYFRLGCYLAPSTRNLDLAASDYLFCDGGAAVTYAGTWLQDLLNRVGSPIVTENLGVALAPGISLVGGTHLVVWKHTRKERPAVDLIRFLTSKEVVAQHPKLIDIPARLDALHSNVYAESKNYEVFTQAIKSGRFAPTTSLWATIEDRLGKTLSNIWHQLNSTPEADLDKVISDAIHPLANRLNATLESLPPG